MGGKALSQLGITTSRKTTDELIDIYNLMRSHLVLDLELESEMVKFYRNKQDHGDLDLLIKLDEIFLVKKINLKDYISNTFNPQAIVHNGNVYSFDYNNFQIDFILINVSDWETAGCYFSYDPISNVIGKTFHKLNLSYGWNGLTYKFRTFNGNLCKIIPISKNPKKIIEFIGYDYNEYLKGFNTLEDIFKFIVGSNYFNRDVFQFENLNYIDRKRNRKRTSYHQFLEYLKDNDINSNYEFKKDKNYYLSAIEYAFPEANFIEQYLELVEEDKLNKLLSEKFNGNIIMEWLPNLKGKDLGIAISNFKNLYGDKYRNYLLNTSIEEIKQDFLSYFTKTIFN